MLDKQEYNNKTTKYRYYQMWVVLEILRIKYNWYHSVTDFQYLDILYYFIFLLRFLFINVFSLVYCLFQIYIFSFDFDRNLSKKATETPQKSHKNATDINNCEVFEAFLWRLYGVSMVKRT